MGILRDPEKSDFLRWNQRNPSLIPLLLLPLLLTSLVSKCSGSPPKIPDVNRNTNLFQLQPEKVVQPERSSSEHFISKRSSSTSDCPRFCTCEHLEDSQLLQQHHHLLNSNKNTNRGSAERKHYGKGLDVVTSVTCSRQNLTSVPEGIPASIRKLDLSWNNLTKIQPHSLSHLYKLLELSLRGNEIAEVESRSAFFLSNLTTLKELTLSRNRLTRLPPTESLPTSLEILDVEHNRIERVEGRVLTRNGRLRALRLGFNRIEFVDEDAFEGLTALTILELNDNKLSDVPAALSKLPVLQELNLANNRITRIDIPFYETIPKIVLLQVRGNPIQAIHPDGFSHLHHLKKLILSDVKNLTDFPQLNGTNSLDTLRIDRCSLQMVPSDLCAFTPNLKTLDLKQNLLGRLPVLSQCTELRVLDLRTNLIDEVEEGSLENLTQLHDLHLSKNRITRIDADTLKGLRNLLVLDLSYNKIDYIDGRAFHHIRKLKDLNLGNNFFPLLPPAGLENVVDLKTHNNPNLREFPGPEAFPSVRTLMLSYAYHCCQFMSSPKIPALVPAISPGGGTADEENVIEEHIWYPSENDYGNVLEALNVSSLWPGFANLSNREELANDFWKKFQTDSDDSDGVSPASDFLPSDGDIFSVKYRPPRPNEISCRPLPGPFLPCSDLFDWWTLRCGVWIVFLLALMGNGTVVFVLIFARTKMDVPRFLVCNLAVADFFMGVYLGFLAVVDAATLGEFRRFAIPWQLSSACQIAGFLGVLSSELSVFTLAVITMERHYAITHAMHLNKRLSLRHASYIMVCGWIFALIMALLPLFGISDYRKFAVCLPFETEDPASLGYVVFLMFANGVAFTILMGCYLKMYCSIRGSQAWNSNDTRIAKRMALLVFTDLLCWFPIAFFSLTAIFGLQLVSLEEAKVFTVFILPLNSCCNPFLYAILTKQFKKDCVLICKAIEESRVTRGIGRCRHSSNFSNRQTAPNTGSLTEKSSKDGQPCICHSGLGHAGGDVNGNAKINARFVQRSGITGGHVHRGGQGEVGLSLGRFLRRYLLCQDVSKDGANSRGARGHLNGSEEDYRMRNVRRYLYNTAGGTGGYPPGEVEGKHQRHASVSSDNFSSSRSDSWRVQNRCGIPLRMIEPRRRNSWAVTRKPSQDSNLSSSRNDSSATSNSTATWRLSRSSVSSDAASHSGGGKSSFKRITPNQQSAATAGNPQGGGIGVLGGVGVSRLVGKATLPTSTAAVAAAAAAAAVAGAECDLSKGLAAIAGGNSEEEMAQLTLNNTIQNQNLQKQLQQQQALPLHPLLQKVALAKMSPRKSNQATGAGGPAITTTPVSPGDVTLTKKKKKKKKKVKIKKPQKKEIRIIQNTSGQREKPPGPEIDQEDDEIDEEEASAKIATNRPRLVRQSAFFSEEVVIEPEVCPVHGPLNSGTYDDEDEEEEVSADEDDDDSSDDEDEDEEGEEENADGNGEVEVDGASHHSHHSHHSMAMGIEEVDEEDEDDEEDPTSPILRKQGIAGIALVIVPRRLSRDIRSRDRDDPGGIAEQQQSLLRPSGSSSSINKPGGSPTLGGGGRSPILGVAGDPSHPSGGGSSPTALLLPAGMAHFGRRKMSEQPVKFYVVPATTGLLNSAKWHSMSCVDTQNTSPVPSGGSSPNQQPRGAGSHSPRLFARNVDSPGTSGATGRRLSASIIEVDVDEDRGLEETPVRDRDGIGDVGGAAGGIGGHQRSQQVSIRENLVSNERRVSFQLPGIQLPGSSRNQSQSPTSPQAQLPSSSSSGMPNS